MKASDDYKHSGVSWAPLPRWTFLYSWNLYWDNGHSQHIAHKRRNCEKGQPNIECDKGFDVPGICYHPGRANPGRDEKAGQDKPGASKSGEKENESNEAQQAYGRGLI